MPLLQFRVISDGCDAVSCFTLMFVMFMAESFTLVFVDAVAACVCFFAQQAFFLLEHLSVSFPFFFSFFS